MIFIILFLLGFFLLFLYCSLVVASREDEWMEKRDAEFIAFQDENMIK